MEKNKGFLAFLDSPTVALVSVLRDSPTDDSPESGLSVQFMPKRAGGGLQFVHHVGDRLDVLTLEAETSAKFLGALVRFWTGNRKAYKVALSPESSADRIAARLVASLEELRSRDADTTANLLVRFTSDLRDEFGA